MYKAKLPLWLQSFVWVSAQCMWPFNIRRRNCWCCYVSLHKGVGSKRFVTFWYSYSPSFSPEAGTNWLTTWLQIQSGASKKLYDMIDVLREGNMRWDETCAGDRCMLMWPQFTSWNSTMNLVAFPIHPPCMVMLRSINFCVRHFSVSD